ncbi:MAG: 16S rRNA (guanine(527)-N(7))-methyltransferase RsmG [Nitrosomonadales bacterium]|nr:MAG: 16S rRNA (guanine(527)-N(7))-methyltransferase RsmG [Nitrosomonadales bacterium]
MNLVSQLAEGIADLGLTLPHETSARLLQYLALVRKWGQVYNLTAVCQPEAMLTQHLFDSLVVLPHMVGSRIADVGSGAGLPGIPLALVRPDWHIVLLESNQKKAAFLQQARIELGLKNVEVIEGRVENFHPTEKFNTVISRAFSSLVVFVRLAGHLCREGDGKGVIVAMKGASPQEDLAQFPEQFVIDKVLPIVVPGLAAKRHLVLIKRA